MAFGGIGAENPAQPCSSNQNFIWRGAFIHLAHPIQTLSTEGERGAGWARDSPRGPLSADASKLRCPLASSLAPIMALQTAAALQQRSKPLRRSMRRRKMNAISPLPIALRPFFFVFPPLPAIKCSALRR
jgi:hypothetical protein